MHTSNYTVVHTPTYPPLMDDSKPRISELASRLLYEYTQGPGSYVQKSSYDSAVDALQGTTHSILLWRREYIRDIVSWPSLIIGGAVKHEWSHSFDHLYHYATKVDASLPVMAYHFNEVTTKSLIQTITATQHQSALILCNGPHPKYILPLQLIHEMSQQLQIAILHHPPDHLRHLYTPGPSHLHRLHPTLYGGLVVPLSTLCHNRCLYPTRPLPNIFRPHFIDLSKVEIPGIVWDEEDEDKETLKHRIQPRPISAPPPLGLPKIVVPDIVWNENEVDVKGRYGEEDVNLPPVSSWFASQYGRYW